MMEGNKDEADKCIDLAERYMKERNREKAEKFLHKAERLYPTQKAKDLLLQASLMAEKPVDSEPRRRKPVPKAEEVKKAPEYTQDQLEAVQKINKCKDYYDILGVSKDAPDAEIKKQYKKLALQFHPDKNKCPGAAEAFKSIGNAMSVLMDVKKRKEYDLRGHDDQSMWRNHQHHSYAREFDTDVSDELFNLFFGAGAGGPNVYVRRGGRWQRQGASGGNGASDSHTHREQRSSNYTAFIQLLPILLAIVLSMVSSFLVSDSPYSLQRSTKYPVLRTTQGLKVDYFVKENFHTEYQGSVRRLELSVEEEFVTNLRHSCYREKNYRDSMIWKARNFGDKELFQAAQNIKMPACDKLITLNKKYA